MQTCLNDTGHKIVRELYQAVRTLTDDPGLLSCIGSWGDTMDDAEVLAMLKRWNDGAVRAGPPAALRVKDLFHHIDMGFLNRRLSATMRMKSA